MKNGNCLIGTGESKFSLVNTLVKNLLKILHFTWSELAIELLSRLNELIDGRVLRHEFT